MFRDVCNLFSGAGGGLLISFAGGGVVSSHFHAAASISLPRWMSPEQAREGADTEKRLPPTA